MTMMSTFFIALAALAAIHFIYESILAPSLRFELRLKLFALRDELRILKQKHAEAVSDEIFRDLQGSLNATISRLNLIDVTILKTAHERFENDEKLRRKSERFDQLISDCAVPEVETIRQKHLKLIGRALLINTGGWFVYLIPIFIAIFYAGRVMAQLKPVFALPENDINKIVPDPIVAA